MVAKILDKPVEEIVGNTDAELLEPAVAGPLMTIYREIMLSVATRRLEETLPLAGSDRVFYSTKAPYRAHEGHVIGVIGGVLEHHRVEESRGTATGDSRGRARPHSVRVAPRSLPARPRA
jgi:hypothetical protein